jgi:Tfp pilus assembly protein PilF
MSIIENLFHGAQKTAQHSDKQKQVQPTLLRTSVASAWYTNHIALCCVIFFIAFGMVLLGVILSNANKYAAHRLMRPAPVASKSIVVVPPVVLQTHPVNNTQHIQMTYTNSDANHFYDDAVLLMKNDRGVEAIAKLEKAIHINPHFEKAREALAALYIQNDNVSAAMTVLNNGLALLPGYPPFIKLKAQIFVNEGLYDQALNLLTQNMPTIENNTGYYALLAAVYDKKRQYLVAADIYHQLTQVNPDNGQWWFGMGASLNLAGKTNQAKMAYRKALQANGLKPDVRAYLEGQL